MSEVNPVSSNLIKVITISAAVVLVAGLLTYAFLKPKVPDAPEIINNAASIATSSPEATPNPTPEATGIKTPPSTGHITNPVSLPKTTVAPSSILAPSTGDVWKVNSLHALEWSNQIGVVGGLVLADANTKKIIGWIEAYTDLKQTSFSWYVHDVYASRISGEKVVVKPGTYVAILQSDQKFADVVSSPFTVIFGGQQETLTLAVRLIGDTVTPRGLTIPKGSKVVFINNDTAVHKIHFGADSFELAPNGGNYLMGTNSLAFGVHNFTSDSFQGEASLIVQ